MVWTLQFKGNNFMVMSFLASPSSDYKGLHHRVFVIFLQLIEMMKITEHGRFETSCNGFNGWLRRTLSMISKLNWMCKISGLLLLFGI